MVVVNTCWKSTSSRPVRRTRRSQEKDTAISSPVLDHKVQAQENPLISTPGAFFHHCPMSITWSALLASINRPSEGQLCCCLWKNSGKKLDTIMSLFFTLPTRGMLKLPSNPFSAYFVGVFLLWAVMLSSLSSDKEYSNDVTCYTSSSWCLYLCTFVFVYLYFCPWP